MRRTAVLHRHVLPVQKILLPTQPHRESMWRQRLQKSSQFTRATEAEDTKTETLWDQFLRIQRTQQVLSKPELARTLIQNSTVGLLTVLSSKEATLGFPKASIVNYVAGVDGKPIFSLSSLAAHTHDLREDDRVSLLASDGSPLSLRSEQVVLTGRVCVVETEVDLLRQIYLDKKPDAIYVDFGDFSWFKMEEVVEVRYLVDAGSNARFSTFPGDRYLAAQADPVAECLLLVKDLVTEPERIVETLLGFKVDSAQFVKLDALGLSFDCTKQGFVPFTCRVSFKKRAETVAEVEEQIHTLNAKSVDRNKRD
eukprot:g8445.t1